jgi:hypothetical protein
VILVEAQPQLPKILSALDASGSTAHLLNSWKQKAKQNRDDAHNQQQLDQRERSAG